mgnify:CR=1 FL=1
MVRNAIIVVLAGTLMGCGWAWAQEAQPGPVLNVVAHLEPCLTIELSDNAISFHADRGPGAYDADKMIEVRVATNYGSWTVNCAATPLTGALGEIPPSRLFTSNNNTLSSPDEGAGPTYENMGGEKLVASGGPQALSLVNTMRFRLKTEWTDRPGQYTGTVSFTYLATP